MKFKKTIGIIGMGYVGLPLAVAFGKKQRVIGFDINEKRVNELISGYDNTNEIDKKNLKNLKYVKFSNDISDLKSCNIYIVTVPTPVDKNNNPNLKPLLNATKIISKVLTKDNLVIYESTVFPGATEELCGPILERNSKLKINRNLYLGYSPERINPGDKKRQLTNIVKIVSGSNNKAQAKVSKLYSSIIKAGIYKAESIKIAEAAKVIENTQRDLNIAFVNELSLIFKKLNLSTEKVLKAAETKWNFISFRPGLVGGHCIGVDPYYLTYKSNKIGYKPQIILRGRNLNDQMSLNAIKAINPKKIFISPGPGKPEDAGISIEIIKKFGSSIPILGICLGHQAIAVAFGGKVDSANEIVHGKTSFINHFGSTIFKNLPKRFEATRYHSLVALKKSIPNEIRITAETDNGLIMGIEHQKYKIYGVQFHPESILTECGMDIIKNFIEL